MHTKNILIATLVNPTWALSIPLITWNLDITISEEPLRTDGMSRPFQSLNPGPNHCGGHATSDDLFEDLPEISDTPDATGPRTITFESFELGDIFEPIEFQGVNFTSGSILSLESAFPNIAEEYHIDRVWVTTSDDPSLAFQFADKDTENWGGDIGFVESTTALDAEGIPSTYLRVRSDPEWFLSPQPFSLNWTKWGSDQQFAVLKHTSRDEVIFVNGPQYPGYLHTVDLTFSNADSTNFAFIAALKVY